MAKDDKTDGVTDSLPADGTARDTGAKEGRRSLSLIPRDDDRAVMPAILEFQSPSTAIITAPVPRSARHVVWMITALFFSCIVAMGIIPIDKVVSAQGKLVSRAANQVVQPLETAIVRSIEVQEGQIVRAGDVLAKLDPTFAAADMGALAASVASLQAEVSREQAEVDAKPFAYSGLDPNLSLQAAIFAQRQAEWNFRVENYDQKIRSLAATMQRSVADADLFAQRVSGATQVENMRRELDKLGVGSKLNTLGAVDSRLEVQRDLENARNTAEGARRDLAAAVAERDGFEQNWKSDIAQKLAESTRKLSDAREDLNKAQLRRQLVEMRADRDATVLSIAAISVGSVMQSGQELMTLVPLDAPLEVETNISGRDSGYVRLGDPVAIKFDTFQYSRYGLAYGHVRTVSADSFTARDDRPGGALSGAVPLPNNTNEPFYRSRVSIDELRLHDTPPDFRITPGMPVTADIKVGKRTALGYLLSRVLRTTGEAMREP